MVEWLAGNRIRGTSTERGTMISSLPSGSVGGWKEVGRTTLGSAGDTITVASLADKRYYMVLVNPIMNGATPQTSFRMGNSTIDTGSNYSWREERDGGTDVTGINATWQTLVGYTANNAMDFAVMNIANLSGKEKLSTSHSVYGVTGAGNAPHRTHNVAKWTNTSNPLDTLQAFNSYLSEFAIGSEVVVLGWDPADTHTTNFWEELASTTLTSAGDLSSGTITAKKYLWVQIYSTTGTSANDYLRFNSDSGTNYSDRKSADGATDATRTGQTALINHINEGGRTTPSFTNLFIINNSANEKLVTGHVVQQLTAGAGNAPSRLEVVGKWANTSSQITNITAFGTLGIGSIIKVWGSN
jgi:hypothetical protein